MVIYGREYIYFKGGPDKDHVFCFWSVLGSTIERFVAGLRGPPRAPPWGLNRETVGLCAIVAEGALSTLGHCLRHRLCPSLTAQCSQILSISPTVATSAAWQTFGKTARSIHTEDT